MCGSASCSHSEELSDEDFAILVDVLASQEPPSSFGYSNALRSDNLDPPPAVALNEGWIEFLASLMENEVAGQNITGFISQLFGGEATSLPVELVNIVSEMKGSETLESVLPTVEEMHLFMTSPDPSACLSESAQAKIYTISMLLFWKLMKKMSFNRNGQTGILILPPWQNGTGSEPPYSWLLRHDMLRSKHNNCRTLILPFWCPVLQSWQLIAVDQGDASFDARLVEFGIDDDSLLDRPDQKRRRVLGISHGGAKTAATNYLRTRFHIDIDETVRASRDVSLWDTSLSETDIRCSLSCMWLAATSLYAYGVRPFLVLEKSRVRSVLAPNPHVCLDIHRRFLSNAMMVGMWCDSDSIDLRVHPLHRDNRDAASVDDDVSSQTSGPVSNDDATENSANVPAIDDNGGMNMLVSPLSSLGSFP